LINKGKVEIFDKNWEHYDQWFKKHKEIYLSELKALQKLVPHTGPGLEIGVGTGRFAEQLAAEFGLDPSLNMLKVAQKRKIKVVQGIGESLPFKNEAFNFILIVVTICFVNNPFKVLKEAFRVLAKGGFLILGIIDRNSPWGKYYAGKASQSKYYKAAHFFSSKQIISLLASAGGEVKQVYQTLLQPPPDLKQVEEPKSIFGQGGFVVLKAVKK